MSQQPNIRPDPHAEAVRQAQLREARRPMTPWMWAIVVLVIAGAIAVPFLYLRNRQPSPQQEQQQQLVPHIGAPVVPPTPTTPGTPVVPSLPAPNGIPAIPPNQHSVPVPPRVPASQR